LTFIRRHHSFEPKPWDAPAGMAIRSDRILFQWLVFTQFGKTISKPTHHPSR